MDGGWLWQAFAYLAAAVVAVPIAQRFGLGSVLGYLIAGVVIGPFAIGVLGTDRQDVLHFAEFGVVMMLFVIGLELEPVLLWRLRHLILGLGGLQVVVTGAVVAAIAIGIGVPVRAVVLSRSSPARDPSVEDNAAWLARRHGVPVLGPVPYLEDPERRRRAFRAVLRPLLELPQRG